jgi:hypothetical protein
MRILMRAGALVLAASLVVSMTAMAAETPAKSEVSGTMVGDVGGAYQTWNVTLPKSTDVTLTLNHWPCNTGDAIGIEVWGPSGNLGMSEQKDACTQELAWNTGAGGPAEVKAFNYLAGVGTWWMLTSTGFTLPGATAPKPVAEKPAAETAEMAKPAAAAVTTTAAKPAAEAAEKPAVAAKPATQAAPGMLSVNNVVLYGTEGGGIQKYDLMVKKGTTYNAVMDFASPNGGTWPGVGFKVWGPDGLVAESQADEPGQARATFTAGGDDKYYVEAYNYHSGVPIFYALSVKPAQ